MNKKVVNEYLKKGAAVFGVDGSISLMLPSFPPKNDGFSLEQLQKAVGGQIEFYPLLVNGCYVIVNEEGLLYDLPFNWNFYEYSKKRVKAVGSIALVPTRYIK
jgi:hypothetical protein